MTDQPYIVNPQPLVPGAQPVEYMPPMQPEPIVQSGLVSNQVEPFQIIGERPFSTKSIFTICPACHSPIYTNVTRKFSALNCILYCCCSGCWMIHKCWNVKDYNCYDADHTCPKCNANIGKYDTC